MAITGALAILRMKVVTSVCRRVTLMERSLVETPVEAAPCVANVIRELGPYDVATYRELRPEISEREILARFDRGNRCFGAWHEGRLSAAGWLATGRGPLPYLRGELELEAGDCFVYDAHTSPAARRLGLNRARRVRALAAAREHGARRALAAVAIENGPGLATLLNGGFREVGLYGWRRVPDGRRWERSLPGRRLPILVPER
jgi:hypothetical protein